MDIQTGDIQLLCNIVEEHIRRLRIAHQRGDRIAVDELSNAYNILRRLRNHLMDTSMTTSKDLHRDDDGIIWA